MTLGTIIAIVLGIAVLVFLIFGFSSGWGNMWDKITNFGGGSDNVAAVVQGCELACSSESTYDYCTKKRELVLEGAIPGLTSGEEYTCNFLEAKATELGMANCDLPCGPATASDVPAAGLSPADEFDKQTLRCMSNPGYTVELSSVDGVGYKCTSTSNFPLVTYLDKEYLCCKKASP